MKTPLAMSLFCGLCLTLTIPAKSAANEPAVAETPVTVELSSGRSFAGNTDLRTDESQFRLSSPLG